MGNRVSIYPELKKLDIRARNQVRAIVASEAKDGVRILNSLRHKRSVQELIRINVVLDAFGSVSSLTIPQLFPSHPETEENYRRLEPLPLAKQLALLDALCKAHAEKLGKAVDLLRQINIAILKKDCVLASSLIGIAYQAVGASHLLLRKAALVSVQKQDGEELSGVDLLLEDAGIRSNNLVSSSLINCFQDGQDFLSMKKSMLNLPNKGELNKFTRDILRLAFHPHARDTEDFCELLHSSSQSSLLDATVIAKVNRYFFEPLNFPYLNEFFDKLEAISDLEDIARQYVDVEDGEELFYKRSSAWLENSSIVQYRTLQDHFYDIPESPYIELSPALLDRIGTWVADIALADLPGVQKMTRHTSGVLSVLERDGFTTRSAVFNYLVAKCEGYATLSEDGLIALMSRTRDLSKTVNPRYLKNLAACSSSPIVKLIYYLLIARKSKNEADDHQLRRILQQIVIEKHNGRLPEFLVSVSGRSRIVAEYMYEVFTEDFIAKLSRITHTASQITETRAALHRFMGEMTGEKIYLDRARTLLIDHQINKLRNEIDDNRIYVDASRFLEWINDELMRELNAVLTSMDLVSPGVTEANPQVLHIISRCYASFCGSTVFGIASYLGRRIRHGTFKGHLYSSLINLSKSARYAPLLEEQQVKQVWTAWQTRYEAIINEIIVERLHVESPSKRQALLKPGLDDLHKVEIANACARAMWRDYSDRKTSQLLPQILVEYCWRMLEVDLRNVNTFLKGKKQELIGADLLTKIKACAYRGDLAAVFCRDLTHHINEKLTAMYGWFKRPVSVSPKASLSLLFGAVVAEVQDTFPYCCVSHESEGEADLELVGGPYHVLYDAFYVVIYNAAKHGHPQGTIARNFKIVMGSRGEQLAANITISSRIRDCDTDEYVNSRLKVNPEDNLENAQVSEDRSGIRKLHQLARADPNFSVEFLSCINREVIVSMSYSLEH
jgi:hypothetical protein